MVALVAALGGTAVALPGKNKVDKNDIKRNAVASKQIKNNAVTGADVNESRLGQVPNAASADNATRANSAGTADSAATATSAASATNAETAANALAVGGKQVVSFEMVVPDNQPPRPWTSASSNLARTAPAVIPTWTC